MKTSDDQCVLTNFSGDRSGDASATNRATEAPTIIATDMAIASATVLATSVNSFPVQLELRGSGASSVALPKASLVNVEVICCVSRCWVSAGLFQERTCGLAVWNLEVHPGNLRAKCS